MRRSGQGWWSHLVKWEVVLKLMELGGLCIGNLRLRGETLLTICLCSQMLYGVGSL